MQRKRWKLMPLEQQILDAIGSDETYGYDIAARVRDSGGSKNLAAHGTLYRALDRLVQMGELTRRWEDDESAEQRGGPRRRLYRRQKTESDTDA